jgi:hypothetical protein
MIPISRFLLLLINIDQETLLRWFGIEDSVNSEIHQTIWSDYDKTSFDLEPSTTISVDTFKLIVRGLWEKIQDGLTLSEIENVLFFILFIRFVVFALKYNIKTSFYITCIALFAGYLWYRHLLDLVAMYRNVLGSLPFFHKLGTDVSQLRLLRREMIITDLRLGENVHWYSPAKVLYYAIAKGITSVDPETGIRYYIDPISMIISNIPESSKAKITPLYYTIYNWLVPKILNTCSKLWAQLSGIAAYVLVTRIGKKYCPYLVRWHWTFIVIIHTVEQIVASFLSRAFYFQTFVLLPQVNSSPFSFNSDVSFQMEFLNVIIILIAVVHVSFVIFALLHAICCQYFYVPFFVENTELHIGPRPKNSIYSGGKTAWQDSIEKKRSFNRLFPKFWYGWFGRGTQNNFNFNFIFKVGRIFKRAMKRIKKII